MILRSSRFARSKQLFNTLDWLPFLKRVEYHRGVMMYKSLHKKSPSYLSDKFKPCSNKYQTRSNKSNLLYVPKPKLEFYRRSFCYSGATLWNNLPEHVRNSPSLEIFRRSLSKHLRCSD